MIYVASLLLFLAWIVILVLYVAFGPRSIVLGFLFGVGLTALTAWIGFKYPDLLIFTRPRGNQSIVLGEMSKSVVAASADPRGTAFLIGRAIGWVLTILAACAALLFATFAIALRARGELTSGMVAAAVLCGICSTLMFVCFKYVARAGYS